MTCAWTGQWEYASRIASRTTYELAEVEWYLGFVDCTNVDAAACLERGSRAGWSLDLPVNPIAITFSILMLAGYAIGGVPPVAHATPPVTLIDVMGPDASADLALAPVPSPVMVTRGSV